MRSLRWIALLLTALVAAAWLWSREDDSARAVTPNASDEPSAIRPVETHSPEAATDEHEIVADTTRAVPADGSPREETRARLARLVVQGRVRAMRDDLAQGKVYITATPSPQPGWLELPERADVDENGRFSWTSLPPERPIERIWVGLEHPLLRCALVERAIDVPEARWHEPDPIVVEVALDLGATATLHGTVRVLPPDIALQALGVFALPSERPVMPSFDSRQYLGDTNATFDLTVPSGGRYAIVAVGKEARPATKIVDVATSGWLDVGELFLDHGAELSGRVEWRGEPLSGSALQAELRAPNAPTLALGQVLRWVDGEFESAYLPITSHSDGRFESFAAALGTYELSGRLGSPTIAFQRSSLVVETPATGLTWRPELRRIGLRLVRSGAAAPRAVVSVTTRDTRNPSAGMLVHADDSGVTSVLAEPGLELEFALDGGSVIQRLTVRDDAELTLDLDSTP